MRERSSGILLPVCSLPSSSGIGDLGPAAYGFIDFLSDAAQSFWQVLPLTPPSSVHDYSPYHCTSAFALDPLIVSPELLAADGLLDDPHRQPDTAFPEDHIEYPAVARFKRAQIDDACRRFRRQASDHDYIRFCAENMAWLEDYARFTVLAACHSLRPWDRWPSDLRDRTPEAIRRLEHEMHDAIEDIKIVQYLLHRQWNQLRAYATEKSIRLIGDLPIYVPHACTDVWAHPELFRLDRAGRPLAVSGVPPDYFSASGQRWGHPVYRWDAHRETRYDWWRRRFDRHFGLFDIVRIDHFRGLVGYWEIPADQPTAVNGRWVEAPAADFFTELQRRFPCLPVIAEDLGTITADVRETMRRFGIPGMRVLQFGFSGDPAVNPNAPHLIDEDTVVFTGTHDNAPSKGWFEELATETEKAHCERYLGRALSGENIAWEMIRLAMMCRAHIAVLPVQDLLGLGASARFNTPGRMEDNWRWRMTPAQFAALPRQRLRAMTESYGRSPSRLR
jgi:4-alpha-glucanotransferase